MKSKNGHGFRCVQESVKPNAESVSGGISPRNGLLIHAKDGKKMQLEKPEDYEAMDEGKPFRAAVGNLTEQ